MLYAKMAAAAVGDVVECVARSAVDLTGIAADSVVENVVAQGCCVGFVGGDVAQQTVGF